MDYVPYYQGLDLVISLAFLGGEHEKYIWNSNNVCADRKYMYHHPCFMPMAVLIEKGKHDD